MRSQKVEAVRGWQWLVEGTDILFQRPGELLLMGLTCAGASWLINLVPWIGWLTVLLLSPVLFGGLVYSARHAAHGEQLEFADLFVGFGDDGKTMGLITLGLVPLAAGIAGAILGFAMSGLGLFALAQLSVFVLACSAWAVVVISVPQVTFKNVDAPKALRISVDTIAENSPAFGLFAAVVALSMVLIFGFVARIGLSILQPVLGGVAIALIACAVYAAYRELFLDIGDDADRPQASVAESDS